MNTPLTPPNTTNTPKPVVAILTYRDHTRMFRGDRAHFIALLAKAKQHGITAYIVTHDALDMRRRGLIQGYRYMPAQRRWVQSALPFPAIVYNRIPYRKFEQLPAVQQLITACLYHPHIHFFNPGFISKWKLFEWITSSSTLRASVPETVYLQQLSDLTRMCRRHRLLYVKPIKGKAGKGIMRIQQQDGQYMLTIQNDSDTQTTSYDTIAQLYDGMRKLMRMKEYIVQQGIRLAHAHERPFDIRTLIQKNARGQWSVSGVGARIAGVRSITTHVPRGGTIARPLPLLATLFGEKKSLAILQRVQKKSLQLAAHIERHTGHTWGEMSMDIGIDRQGKLWFFEANAKPMKFNEPHIRQKSLDRLMQYWHYLAMHPPKRTMIASWRSQQRRRWPSPRSR